MGNTPALDTREGKVSGYEYLKRKVGILPEAIKCLEAVLHRDKERLLELIPELFKAFNDIDLVDDNMKIDPEIVNGLLVIMTNSNKSLENIAEKLKVDQEIIQFCLKLSGLAKGDDDDIPKRLADFFQSPLVEKALKSLEIPMELLKPFLYLTFGAFQYKFLPNILKNLNILQHVDLKFISFLMSLFQSYLSLQVPYDKPLYQDSDHRLIPLEQLMDCLKPVCKQFNIDYELALIAIRIRQGDIFIIEDRQDYMQTLLPCENLRKFAMGVCGVLTLPIRFQRKFEHYPKNFHQEATFESSCEILCDMLNINPIVPRIMMLDDEALDLVETNFGFPKKAVSLYDIIILACMVCSNVDKLSPLSIRRNGFERIQKISQAERN